MSSAAPSVRCSSWCLICLWWSHIICVIHFSNLADNLWLSTFHQERGITKKELLASYFEAIPEHYCNEMNGKVRCCARKSSSIQDTGGVPLASWFWAADRMIWDLHNVSRSKPQHDESRYIGLIPEFSVRLISEFPGGGEILSSIFLGDSTSNLYEDEKLC